MGFRTAVGVSGAAVTLTVPVDGARRWKISRIQIVMYAAAAVAGGAVPITVTTTNLDGLAFTFNSARVIGVTYIQSLEGASDAQAAGVVTIVCPAMTNVIWRVSCYAE